MEESFYQRIIKKDLERKPILTKEQRNQFEEGLGTLVNNCNIQYGHGTIILKPKGLEKK